MDRLHTAHDLAASGLVDRFELWPHRDEKGKLRSVSLTMTVGEVSHLPVITLDRRDHSTAQALLMECAHAIRVILGDSA